jgi:hypothetical protein
MLVHESFELNERMHVPRASPRVARWHGRHKTGPIDRAAFNAAAPSRIQGTLRRTCVRNDPQITLRNCGIEADPDMQREETVEVTLHDERPLL